MSVNYVVNYVDNNADGYVRLKSREAYTRDISLA